MTDQRKYLPTLAELIDRLRLFCSRRFLFLRIINEYLTKERDLIEHDIDMELRRCVPI